MTFPIALSPCPNDTYLFYPWLSGKVGCDLPPIPTFADIQNLNLLAEEGNFPLIKISFGAYLEFKTRYQILPIGCALGFDAGPKLISKKRHLLSDLKNQRIAIPGSKTTAHLAFNRFFGECQSKVFCRYHEVYDLLNEGLADSGLIIHESRFTYLSKGFIEIADLGSMWHEETGFPMPLGALAIKRELPTDLKRKILKILKESLRFSKKHPHLAQSFITDLAQEKNPDVIDAHINLYVNQETESLSEQGILAIESLLDLDRSEWLFSELCTEKS